MDYPPVFILLSGFLNQFTFLIGEQCDDCVCRVINFYILIWKTCPDEYSSIPDITEVLEARMVAITWCTITKKRTILFVSREVPVVYGSTGWERVVTHPDDTKRFLNDFLDF